MAESMVERVARVLAGETYPTAEGDFLDRNWPRFKQPAIAAIEAMREPTAEMVARVSGVSPEQQEAWDKGRGPVGLTLGQIARLGQVRDDYRAMIDAAPEPGERA